MMDEIGKALRMARAHGNGHVIGQPKPVAHINITLMDDGNMQLQWTCDELTASVMIATAQKTVVDKMMAQRGQPKVSE